jgi:putative zinc finger/helix-turn-helix YgiT family protein
MNTKRTDGKEKRASEEQPCPECGSTRVSTRIERQRFPYGEGAEAVELEALVPVTRCSECGFEFLGESAEAIRHEAVCRHLGVLNPDEIREIREEYGFSRAEFSRLTRLGEATLNRWENGILVQNQAYDRFLRLLSFPENVRRLQVATTAESPHSSGSVVSLAAYRFRALKDEANVRREQTNFQLHKRAASA